MRLSENNKATLEMNGPAPVAQDKLRRIAAREKESMAPKIRHAVVDIDRLDAATRATVLAAIESERVDREVALIRAAKARHAPVINRDVQVNVVAPDGKSYPAGDGRTAPYAL